MDKTKKSITFILSLLMSVFVLTAQSNARLITVNPGEDASTEMRISWHTDWNTNSFVKFTEKSDTNWVNAKQVSGEYYVSSTWYDVPTVLRIDGVNETVIQDFEIDRYTAVLSNLQPGTEYVYQIGTKSELPIGTEDGHRATATVIPFSDARHFKTAGTSEFSFAWISDIHAYNPLPNRLNIAMDMVSTIIEQSEQQSVDFIFSTGDILAFGGCYSEWDALFNQNHLRNHTWVSLIGNHDVYQAGKITPEFHKQAFFTDTHNNPPNGYAGQEGASYWFQYNNVLWIVLNSMDLANSAHVPIAQAWAEDIIRNNPAQYIFVAQHFHWFVGSTGVSNPAGFSRWNEFFDKWNVDVAFAGNYHIYIRTHPIYNGEVSTVPGKGTVYIQAPSSDGGRGREIDETSSENADKFAFRWTEGANTVGGSLVTVNEREVTVSLHNRYGEKQDYVVIPAKR